MKQLTNYILLFLLCLSAVFVKANDAGNPSGLRILILNSYNPEVSWAARISTGLEEALHNNYPGAQIYTGFLSLDRSITTSLPLYALRSSLWAFDSSNMDQSVAEDRSLTSVFKSEVHPDLIIFVGGDGFYFYQEHGHFLENRKDIPLVLCAVNDSVTSGHWALNYKSGTLIPVEERKSFTSNLTENTLASLSEYSKERLSKIDSKPLYQYTQDYRITGVKSSLPVRENLELIKKLMPRLEEIVWVDDNYYASGYARELVEQEMHTVLPDVKLTSVVHTKLNSDSIYQEVLREVPNRAFLTYAWNITGMYSKYSERYLNEFFHETSTVPLFSLTEPLFAESHWIGGYYRPLELYIQKTVRLVNQILGGTPVDSIPFETVNEGLTIVDQSLFDKYDLNKNILKGQPDVIFENIPPAFLERNEQRIYLCLVLLIVFAGVLLYFNMWRKHNKILQEEANRYKKLSHTLAFIYEHASIDYALYNKQGQCISSVSGNKIFSDKLFENPLFSEAQKQMLHKNQVVHAEVNTDTTDKFSSSFIDRNCYQVIVIPLNDVDYKFAQYLMLAINLTPVMRERTERERFEALLNFASGVSEIGMAFYNLKTGTIVATKSWYENLNEPQIADSLPYYLNVLPEDRILLLEFRERAGMGMRESLTTDIRIRDSKGKKRWVREYLYTDGKDKNVVIELNINIDQIKKDETELYHAKRDAEQANQETKEFLSNINHEIRTPLNSIVGFSGYLALSDDEEENKEYASMIATNNVLLTNLIDDIIALSMIDSGRVVFEHDKVNLNLIFNDWARYCESLLQDKDIAIYCEVPNEETCIYIDFRYFSRLMMNLLTNAIKFTDKGSIRFGYRIQEDNWYFYVKDSGCGIKEEELKVIFKRFTKLNTFAQGTGLGLALCKSIVEHLGGRIGVKSEPHKGSMFWFTLPKDTIECSPES